LSDAFDRLVALMTRLRSDEGCPWDREQTHDSLKPYLIEETYEVLEAIEAGEATALCEELGDLLFQIVFHAQIAKEDARFTIEDVLKKITEKMIRRHPHVFSEQAEKRNVTGNSNQNEQESPTTPQAVLTRWEEMKQQEPGNRHRKSVLDGVPKSLPSLLRAHQVQARAARVGFDWKELAPVLEKIEEELDELREAVDSNVPERVESEFGDLLFSIVNYGRFLNLNSEDALRGTIARFTQRFQKMESEVKTMGRRLDALSLDEMNRLWEKAKLSESI